MPMFIVERTFAESFDPTHEQVAEVADYFDERDVRWITTFLSPDHKKTYCLYEADSADVLYRHAEEMGFPLDSIIEVSELDIPRR